MRMFEASSRLPVRPERPLRLRDWLLTGLFVVAALSSLAYATLKPRYFAGETLGVVVIGGKPETAMAVIARAGGLVLRDGTFAGSIIARAPDAGFVARLQAAGASLVYRVDGSANCAGAASVTDKS